MATDDKKKGHDRLDPFAEVNDDDWFDAVEAWDTSLDLPAAQARRSVPERPPAELQEIDPLVKLIDGEMDIDPESGGQALGVLLGNEPSADDAADVAAAGALDLGPDDVAPTSGEVEILSVEATASAWSERVETTPATAPRTSTTDAEVQAIAPAEELPGTEAGDAGTEAGDAGVERATAEVQAISPAEELPGTGIARSGAADLQLEPASAADVDAAAAVDASELDAPTIESSPPVMTPEAGPPRTAAGLAPYDERPLPPPLALFDEILPTDDEPRLAVEPEAGELLPLVAPRAVLSIGPGHLDGIEDEDEPEPATLAASPLTPELMEVDPVAIAAPETGRFAPLEPSELALIGEAASLQANLVDNTRRAADLQLLAAQAAEATGDIEDALAQYQEVLHHRPGYLPALQALWRLHVTRKQPAPLVEVIREISQIYDGQPGQVLRAAAADLLWTRGGDDHGARTLIEESRDDTDDTDDVEVSLRTRLVELDLAALGRDDEQLRRSLASIVEAHGEEPAAAVLYVDLGHGCERDGKLADAAVHFRKATTGAAGEAWEGLLRCGEQLGDLPLVAEALAASAPLLGPWEGRRRRRLASLARLSDLDGVDPVRELEAAALSDPGDPLVIEEWAEALREASRTQEAVAAFRRLSELRGTAIGRAQALVEAAIVAEAGEQRAEALQLYLEAAAQCPDHVLAGDGISRLQQNDPAPERRIEAHRAAAAGAAGALRAVHHLAAARVLDRELAQPRDAVTELLNALEHDPGCTLALSWLEPLYRAIGELPSLAAALDTAATAIDDPAQAAGLCQRAAELYLGVLGDPESALRRYRQLLEIAPERLEVRAGLQQALLQLGRQRELAEEMAHDAQVSDGERAAVLWLRRGQLLLSTDPDEAETSLRLALGQVPSFPPAVWSLASLLAARKDWTQVAELWSTLAETLPEDSRQRGSLLLRAAALQEGELGDRESARVAYAAAAALPNPAPGAVEALHRLDDHDPAGLELERALDSAPDPAMRFALLLANAESVCRAGVDRAESEASYQRLLELSPDHPMARRGLEEQHIEHGAWQSLAELLMADLERSTDASQRVLLYDRLAEIDLARGDQLGADVNRASILELQPDHVDALRQRQSRLLREQAWHDLGRTVERIARRAPAADAGSFWLELGRLVLLHEEAVDGREDLHERDVERERERDDQEVEEAEPPAEIQPRALAAVAPLQAAVEQDPRCLLALHSLADIWLAAGRAGAGRFADLLTRLAAAATDDAERAALLSHAATIRGASAEDYRAVVERLPRFPGPICRLRRAALLDENWPLALQAAEAEASAGRVAQHVLEASLLASQLAVDMLQDAERALVHCRRALQFAPDDRWAFEQLRAILEAREAWPELVALLEQRLGVESDPGRRLELHQQLAAVASRHLGDTSRSMQHLRAVLEHDGRNVDALRMLADLYADHGQWPEAADALIRLAQLERDHRTLGALFMRLGVLYQEHAPDPARAIAALRKVVALDGNNREALHRLGDLYLENLDFEAGLRVTTQLLELERDRQRQVQLLLRTAKIHEDGLRDVHQASLAFRRALEVGPTDLEAIGALCGFYARQGDQRSMMVHLDRSVSTMRSRLQRNPFDAFAYQALFRIFGWRKAPDACLCAAQTLDAFDQAGAEEREFIDRHVGAVGAPGPELGRHEHDEWMFQQVIPGGFRQIFQLLADSFGKIRRGDLQSQGVTRADRAPGDHPARRVADQVAADLGISSYRLFISSSSPIALFVENTEPPSVVLGKALVEDASEQELLFLAGRCLWIVARSMILPTRLRPEDLAILVAAVVRQYVSEFQPRDTDLKPLKVMTRQVARVLPRRLKQELMPFALECSGADIDLRGLGAAVIHSANRAGLLACRSIEAGIAVLRKASGELVPPRTTMQRVEMIDGNEEVQGLLRFAVSDQHFELRRVMGVGIR